MNSRFLVFFVSLILAMTAASAQLAIYNPVNSTVNPGINATGTFVLGNTNLTTNVTGTTCVITSSLSPSSTDCATTILNNTNYTVNYWIFVPQYTAAGNYAATITASGTLAGAATTATVPIKVTVNSYPSLSLAWITAPLSSIYSGENNSAILNITNTGNLALTVNLTSTFANSSANDSFTLNPSASILKSINLSTTSKTLIGTNTFTVSALGYSAALSTNPSISRDVDVKYRYCPINSSTNNIYIEDVVNYDDIYNQDFKPLDNMEIKVKVRNSYSESKHVVVEAVLVKNDDISDTEDKLEQKLSDSSSKTFNLNIIIPSDLSRGEYYLFIKVYDDSKSTECEQRSIKFYVDKEDREMLIHGIEVPLKIECDSAFTVGGSLVNLGEESEDKIMLEFNDALGFVDSTTFTDVEEGEMKDFSFTSTIPKNATEKQYRVILKAYYNYDEDDDSYDDTALFFYPYIVSGNCFKEIRNASFSAMTQTAFASQDSDVTFSVTNTGNVQETYTFTASSNDFLIKSISPSIIVLPAGSTVPVTLKVLTKENITSGVHNIAVGIAYGGKSETKTISLNVQKESSIVKGFYGSIKDTVKKASWLTIINVIFAIVVVILFIKLLTAKKATSSAKAEAVSEYKSNIKKNFK